MHFPKLSLVLSATLAVSSCAFKHKKYENPITAQTQQPDKILFDKAISDNDLKAWILKEQQAAQEKWKIDSTPSFVIDGKKYAGEMSYDDFRKLVPDA